MQKTLKKELSFSLDTLERYRAKYGRSASLDTNGHSTQQMEATLREATHTTMAPAPARSPPPSLFKANSPPKLTKLQELQQKKEAYLRAREHEREMEKLQRAEKASSLANTASVDTAKQNTSTSAAASTNSNPSSATTNGSSSTTNSSNVAAKSNSSTVATTASKTAAGYTNWNNNHTTLSSQPWCAISDLMYFCDKYEFKTLSTRDLKTHQEIVAEVRTLLSGKAPFDQRTRFPGNIYDPENLWVCVGRCASVEYHLQRIISVFRKPLNQLTPDKQRAVRQNFHLAVSELRLDISARISEVRLYDRLVFEREFRLEWQDES